MERDENLATICYPSDRYPATVLCKTDKEIRVQMRGVSNNKLVWPEQDYDTFEDPLGSIYIFSLRKNGKWVTKGTSMNSFPILAIGYARYYQAPEL